MFSVPLAAQPPSPPPESAELPKPISLKQAEDILLRKNLMVAASRQQVEIADALRRIAGLKPNPTLQLGAEQFSVASPVPYRVSRPFVTNSNAGANPVMTIQYGQSIERGGKRMLRSQQADAFLDAAKAQVLDAFRQQLLLLRLAFTSALLARENLKLAEATDAQYASTEKLMEARLQAGDIAGIDVERVRAARLPFQQAVLDTRAALWQAARDIATVLSAAPARGAAAFTPGATFEPVLEIAGELSDPQIAAPLDELVQMAVQARPDLQVARSLLKASESGSRLAVAQKTRDLNSALEYQRVGNDTAMGVVVSFPLFVHNNQSAAIAQAAAQQRLAATQAKLMELQVVADVEKAYQSVAAARRTLNLYSREALQRTEGIRTIVNYSYQRGEASLLEALDAQRTAVQTQVAYNQARANYLNSLWLLQSALGKTQ